MTPSAPFAVVVNDDPTQLEVLSALLRKAGLEPRAFAGAEAALADMSARAAAADGDPDALPALVVTDLYMPGIDGWRFCRLLRSPEYAAFNEVPILLVSATYAGEEVDRIAADLGAEAFLHSPVNGKRFVEQVRAILKGRQVLKPLRALIVEDDKSLADKLKKALAAHGYQADIALTAQAADDAFLKAAYDVAVLDHHLPDGAGDALLDAFRAERPDCVCLMMTTDPGPELALDWMKRGAAAYLRKPFKPEYLIELCERARRERALLRVQDLLEVRTRELRESEGKHFVLLEQSSDPIYSVTPEGRYTYVNPAFAAGVGKPVENIIGNSIWDVFPREEAYQRFASLSQVIRTGEEQVIEERVPRADGDRYYITTITPIADAAGKVGSAICSSKDITERKRAEDELRYNSAIIAQANDAIIATKNDAGFTITKWNPGAEKIYGWQEKEVLGRSSMFLQNEYPGQDPRKVLETILEAGLYEGEVIQSRKDGTRVLVDTRLIARKDNNGATTDWICINRDITERKRAEEALRESEDKYRVVFNNEIYAICIFDLETLKLLDANEAYVHLYGYSRAELVSGMTIHDITAEHQVSDAATKRAVREGTILIPLRYHRKKDGTIFPVEIVGGPYAWQGRKVMFAIAHDITERQRAEEALRKSIERSQAVQRIGRVGYLDWDLSTNDIVFSREALEIYHLDSSPTLGQIMDLVHPDDKERVENSLNAAVSGTARHDLEHRMVCPDGAEIHVQATADVFRNDDGTPARVLGTVRDITARKQAEEALRESEERFRRVSATTSDIAYLCRTNEEGRFSIDWMTGAAGRITGYSGEEIKAQGCWRFLIVEEDRAVFDEHVIGLAPGSRDSCEFRIRHKNGGIAWIASSAECVSEPQTPGRRSLYGGLVDITERKQAEETLRDSSERMRAVIEGTPHLFFYTQDAEANTTYVSPTVERITGHTADIWLKRKDWFVTDAAINQAGKERTHANLLGDFIDEPMLLEVRHAIGHPILLEVFEYPITRDGRVVGLQGVAHDVTQRKRSEEEKAGLETQLHQAQKLESVGRLAGGVAHDFNNMLGVILGRAEVALGDVDPAQPLHAHLDEIHKAAQRSASLTRQLLAFARKQTIAPLVLNLNETIEGTLRMLRRLIGEDIQLDWQPEAGLWPVRVDPSQVDQILANLCLNARDAIADVGKLTIETANSTFDADHCALHAGLVPGEYVRLAVSDDGCGMDKETLAHVFEPFFTTKDVGAGTGLGLATVYGIVKQNNGFINVSSEPGQGTTFTIYLPRHVGKAEQARGEDAGEPLVRGHETILLVEDEPAILEMTTEMLQLHGYVVLAALTPGEAIRMAREHVGEIHLVMTDVVLPEMNGRDLAKNLLSIYPHLKHLFMSGYTADLIAHRGVLDDGVHFLQKPFSMKGLAAKVREALDSE